MTDKSKPTPPTKINFFSKLSPDDHIREVALRGGALAREEADRKDALARQEAKRTRIRSYFKKASLIVIGGIVTLVLKSWLFQS